MRDFTKLAVTLSQLRRANRASRALRNRAALHAPSDQLISKGKALKAMRNDPKTVTNHFNLPPRNANVPGGVDKRQVFMAGSPRRYVNNVLRAGSGGIGGGSGFPRAASPARREAFNRSIFQHEVAEGRAARRGKGHTPFASHISLTPPLQDMNIAATLRGKGRGAAGDIRAMRRDEIELLRALHPSSFGRLDIGNERLSRHAIKRLNEVYTRGIERIALENIKALFAGESAAGLKAARLRRNSSFGKLRRRQPAKPS